MENKTEFYEMLVKARTDDNVIIIIIEKIMPLINRHSQIEKDQIDEELKNYLIEYAIKVIREKNFAEKLSTK